MVPGYNYMGPGNSLNKGPAVNLNDLAAKEHDIGYDELIKKGKNPYLQWNKADKLMQETIQDDGTFGYKVSDTFLSLKRVLAPEMDSSASTSAEANMPPPAKVPRVEAPQGAPSGGTGGAGGGSHGEMSLDNYAVWEGNYVTTVATRQTHFKNTVNDFPYAVHQAVTSDTPPVKTDFYSVQTDWNLLDFNAIAGHFPHVDLQRLYRCSGVRPKHVKVEFEHTVTLVTNDINGSQIVSAFAPGQVEVAIRPRGVLPYKMTGEKKTFTSTTSWTSQKSPYSSFTVKHTQPPIKYAYNTSFALSRPSTTSAENRPMKVTYLVEHGTVNHLPIGGRTGYEWDLDTTWLDNHCFDGHIMDGNEHCSAINSATAQYMRTWFKSPRMHSFTVNANRTGRLKVQLPNSDELSCLNNKTIVNVSAAGLTTGEFPVDSVAFATGFTSQTTAYNSETNEPNYSNWRSGVQQLYNQWLEDAVMFDIQPKGIKNKITQGKISPIMQGPPPPMILFRQRPVPTGAPGEFLNLQTCVTSKVTVTWEVKQGYAMKAGFSGFNMPEVNVGGFDWELSGVDGAEVQFDHPHLDRDPNWNIGPPTLMH